MLALIIFRTLPNNQNFIFFTDSLNSSKHLFDSYHVWAFYKPSITNLFHSLTYIKFQASEWQKRIVLLESLQNGGHSENAFVSTTP